MQLNAHFQRFRARCACGLEAARLVGLFPGGLVQGVGIDLIRIDPQFSKPFSPMILPLDVIHCVYSRVASGSMAPEARSAKRCPRALSLFLSSHDASAARERHDRGMGMAVCSWREPSTRPWHNSPSGMQILISIILRMHNGYTAMHLVILRLVRLWSASREPCRRLQGQGDTAVGPTGAKSCRAAASSMLYTTAGLARAPRHSGPPRRAYRISKDAPSWQSALVLCWWYLMQRTNP